MTPLEIQKRLALKLKLNKIDDCGIAAPILLNEILAKMGHTTTLVQGYCSSGSETCWHVWIELQMSEHGPPQKLDIGYTIACLKDSEFLKCTVILHKNVAPGAKEPQRDTESLDLWEIYQKDSKEFWKKQPVRVQNFRAKVLKEKWSP
jgi:hypothetical protein